MSVKRVSLLAVVALSLFALVGCQSSSAPMASSPPLEKALVISGGNTGSVTVLIPSSDPNNPVLLSTSATPEVCSQCKADAIKFFQTGQIETKCPKCGATRTPITVVNTSVGHQ